MAYILAALDNGGEATDYQVGPYNTALTDLQSHCEQTRNVLGAMIVKARDILKSHGASFSIKHVLDNVDYIADGGSSGQDCQFIIGVYTTNVITTGDANGGA